MNKNRKRIEEMRPYVAISCSLNDLRLFLEDEVANYRSHGPSWNPLTKHDIYRLRRLKKAERELEKLLRKGLV